MSQNRERKRKFDIPIWCKANLSIEEAAAYSGIGMAKLYEMTESEDCPFVLWIGTVSFFISVISLNLEFLIYKVTIKNSGDHGYLHTNACHTVIDIKLPFRLTKAKRAAQKKQL